ncbi:MAG: ABC transporter ATP-binding protein, partial [Burkholderiaceae bacterium]
GAAQVVFDANLRLEAGEVVALVGRNGAGKTSLLRAIMGLMDGTRGSVSLSGQDLSRLPSFERARRGLGYVPEDRRIFSDLSVAENLRIAARAQPGGFNEADLLEIFPNLAPMLDRRADQMSGGEQQMLAVARTLATNAAVVLLDEPSEGIAPLVVEKMREAVVAMKGRGVATLLAEQNLRFAASVSDRALLIEHGQLTGEVGREALLEPSVEVRKVLGL